MELTQEYFEQQLKSLATKDDLQRLATKDDLENLATKDDLLELATKTELASVSAEVSEIKEMVQRIDRRTDEDHRAAMRDIVDLKSRISVLESASRS